MTVGELWNLDTVAAHLGVKPKSADAQLRRWGIVAVGREAGREGQNLYDAAQVRAAHESRPGQGARTDLHRDDEGTPGD